MRQRPLAGIILLLLATLGTSLSTPSAAMAQSPAWPAQSSAQAGPPVVTGSHTPAVVVAALKQSLRAQGRYAATLEITRPLQTHGCRIERVDPLGPLTSARGILRLHLHGHTRARRPCHPSLRLYYVLRIQAWALTRTLQEGQPLEPRSLERRTLPAPLGRELLQQVPAEAYANRRLMKGQLLYPSDLRASPLGAGDPVELRLARGNLRLGMKARLVRCRRALCARLPSGRVLQGELRANIFTVRGLQ